MPKLIIKGSVLVVADLKNAVRNTKSLVLILSQRLPGNFNRPIVQVFTVKELQPFCFGCRISSKGSRRGRQQKRQQHCRQRPDKRRHKYSLLVSSVAVCLLLRRH